MDAKKHGICIKSKNHQKWLQAPIQTAGIHSVNMLQLHHNKQIDKSEVTLCHYISALKKARLQKQF